MSREPTLLYCRCAYAQVIPQGVKDEVLRRLGDSGESFETVADLCEMAAHRDPRLEQISTAAGAGGLRIAACYPRAVRGLFRQAGFSLPESGVEVVNMRELSGEAAASRMLSSREANGAETSEAIAP